MGPLVQQRSAVLNPLRYALAPLALFTVLLSPWAPAQTPAFDFGDGRHGSFTLPAGETTIQDLWSQLRVGEDPVAYNPGVESQVPALENLTIGSGSTLTVSAYGGSPLGAVDPTQGGVLRIKVKGTLTIEAGGLIDARGRGYRGGTLEGAAPGRIGQQGDSWGNGGNISGETNRGGGGGGFGEINNNNMPGAGGGGGHREVGGRGTTGAGTATGGLGGATFDTVATNLGQTFRDTYPFPRFGSGGGRGGQVENFVNIDAKGGNGGGVIIIEAAAIVNNGTVRADGAAGGSDISGGGGGAGGAIWIQSLSPANGAISVAGGAGGVGTVLGNDGGAGGAGISLWDARVPLTTATDGEGTVSLLPAGGLYELNNEVTVTAVPEVGWTFDHWEGGLTGTENPAQILMDGAKTVTAFFVESPSLTVTPTVREVGSGATSVDFDVAISGGNGTLNWTAAVTSGSEFVSITAGASGSSDGKITVAVTESTLIEARTATVAVRSGDVDSDPIVLTINQSPALPFLVLTPGSTTINAEGEEVVVQVRNGGTGTFDWTASVLTGTGFATITSGGIGTDSGTFVVTFAENFSELQRTATISVTATGASNSPLQVQLVQQAGVPLLQVTPSSQLIGSAAGNVSLSVTNGGNGTMNWTAAIVEGASFANVSSGSSGTDAGLITVAFTANTGLDNRVARVRVESGDVSNSPVEVVITQTSQEAVLQVTPETQAVGSAAGVVSFQVQNAGTGTMNWSAAVIEGANFINITAGSSGTNDDVITVSVSENTGTTERIGRIQVQAPGAGNNPQVVTVTQSPRTPVLRVVPADQLAGPSGGLVSLTIENSGSGALNWTASIVSGADFVVFSAASNGTGDGTLQLIVSPNDTEETRVATIRVEAPGADGSPQMATITQLGCTILKKPANLAASDGTFSDSVELIWSATQGATSYEIFRSPSGAPNNIELIGTSTEPRFSDTLAESPDYELINRGCFNPGEFIITNIVYFYYVKGINACGTSELSLGTTGHRGLPGGESPPTEGEPVVEVPVVEKSLPYIETVLPNERGVNGAYVLRQEESLALRVRSNSPVDVTRFWAEISGEAVEPEGIVWVPLSDDDTDGWIVLSELSDILPGDRISVLAGGFTVSGEALADVGADFYRVESEAKAFTRDEVVLPYVMADEESGLFLEGLGPILEVAPRSLYPTAREIWVPVPESGDTANLTLYYFGEGPLGAAWYPAAQVVGWLASPDPVVSADGKYLGYQVNHGGVVRVGVRPTTAPKSAGFASGNFGMVAMIVLTSLILLGAGRRRSRPASPPSV